MATKSKSGSRLALGTALAVDAYRDRSGDQRQYCAEGSASIGGTIETTQERSSSRCRIWPSRRAFPNQSARIEAGLTGPTAVTGQARRG